MPPNRVVHRLLTGKKRKAQSIGADICANYSYVENENQKYDTKNSRAKLNSSTFSSQLSTGDLLAPKIIEERHQDTQQRVKQMKNLAQARNKYNMSNGIKVVDAPRKVALSSKRGISTIETQVEESNNNSTTYPIEYQRENLESKSQQCQKRRHLHLRNRCRQRYLRDTIKASGNAIRNENLHPNLNVSNKDKMKRFGSLESLASIRKRQRRSKSALCSTTMPLNSKNDDSSIAETLLRSFLEQRRVKRISSNQNLSTLPSSPFDDPMFFPVILLGISALAQLTEWYSRKQEEAVFMKSSIIRDLVLWMKEREELHMAHTSETIVQKHLDALNQLAKFHESVDESHHASLLLSSQQRKEEKITNVQDQHYRKKEKNNLEPGEKAKVRTKIDKFHSGSDERHRKLKEDITVYHQTDGHKVSSRESKQKQEGQDADQLSVRQQEQREHQQYSCEKEFANESNPNANHDLNLLKTDKRPQKMFEINTATAAKNVSDINNGQDSNNNKSHCVSGLLNQTSQLLIPPVKTLQSSLSSGTDVQPISDAEFRKENRNLRMTTEESLSLTKSPNSESQVMFEGHSMMDKIDQEIELSGGKTCKKSNDSQENSPSHDNVPTIKISAEVLKVKSKAKEFQATLAATDSMIADQGEISAGLQNSAKSCVSNDISHRKKTETENMTGKIDTSMTFDLTRSNNEANHIRDNSRNVSPTVRQTTTRSPSISLSENHFVEENKSGGYVDHANDNGSIDSQSDDRSQILLTQSQKHVPKSRRVTASPRVLSRNNGHGRPERYKHFSKIDFSGQNQSKGYQRTQAADPDRPNGREENSERKRTPNQSSFLSSQNSWMSRAPKRSPSFKQTSLTSSTGWVSNQRARDFVKTNSSRVVPATVVVNSTSDISRRVENGTKEKRGYSVPREDNKGSTPHLDYGFDKPKSKNDRISSSTDEYENVAKMPKIEFASFEETSLERTSPEKRQHGSEAKSVPRNMNGKGISDTYVSSNGAKAVVKNNATSNDFKYGEVVRGKEARKALNGYECEECAAFFDEAVLHGDGATCYNRDELLRCSRHRARNTPPQTPEDFWELSFMDEKKERQRQQASKTELS